MSLLNVQNLSVSQNNQNIVSLIVLRLLVYLASAVRISRLENRREMGGTEQLALIDRALVCVDASFDSFDLWVIKVTI